MMCVSSRMRCSLTIQAYSEDVGERHDPVEHVHQAALFEHEEGETLLLGASTDPPIAVHVAIGRIEVGSLHFEQRRVLEEGFRLGEDGRDCGEERVVRFSRCDTAPSNSTYHRRRAERYRSAGRPSSAGGRRTSSCCKRLHREARRARRRSPPFCPSWMQN